LRSSPEGAVALQSTQALQAFLERLKPEPGPGLSAVDVLSPEQAPGLVLKKGALSCKGSSAEYCASSPSTAREQHTKSYKQKSGFCGCKEALKPV